MQLSELHIAFDPIYELPLPEGHRFPMEKYELIPGQLLHEGIITPENLHAPRICNDHDVLRAHDENYIHRLKTGELSAREQRVIGFPQSEAMIRREWIITQGTINCCYAALVGGVSLNVAGGTHHAFRDHGEGFCILNDFAVAALHILDNSLAQRVIIIDLDVHQGNGTAEILKHNDAVFTFSMHGQHNYPFKKSTSNLDIGLPDGTTDAEYLQQLNLTLPKILDSFRPDFACFLAGADVLRDDRFGRLAMTLEGCAARDRFVLETLHLRGIPCAISMGGGYSPDVKTIVTAHVNTFKIAVDIYLR